MTALYVVSYECGGRGTFLEAVDAEAVRALVGAPTFKADGRALHVALVGDRPLEPASGVHTTVDAVLKWNEGPLPQRSADTVLANREAAVGRRASFLRRLKGVLAEGAAEGILDVAQAAAIARATLLAVTGVGPAGRRGAAQAHAILSHRDRR